MIHSKEDLSEFLIAEAEYTPEEVGYMTYYEMVDNYLTYLGIVGYTKDIISLFNCFTEDEIKKMSN